MLQIYFQFYICVCLYIGITVTSLSGAYFTAAFFQHMIYLLIRNTNFYKELYFYSIYRRASIRNKEERIP